MQFVIILTLQIIKENIAVAAFKIANTKKEQSWVQDSLSYKKKIQNLQPIDNHSMRIS